MQFIGLFLFIIIFKLFINRDLKLENILYEINNKNVILLKVADFGLAKDKDISLATLCGFIFTFTFILFSFSFYFFIFYFLYNGLVDLYLYLEHPYI
jgi:serine/threonine protein kinase